MISLLILPARCTGCVIPTGGMAGANNCSPLGMGHSQYGPGKDCLGGSGGAIPAHCIPGNSPMGGLGSDALHSILNHMPGTGNSGIGSNGIGGIGNSGNMGGMSGMSADGGLGSNQWMGSKSTDIYSLPDPQKLVAAVEQATANFLNIKNNLRRVLERTKMYLSRSAVLLTELTSDIKVKYAELKETTKKHNRESAPHIKAVLAKKMIDLRSELRELIGMFEKIRKWQMTVTCSIATTL